MKSKVLSIVTMFFVTTMFTQCQKGSSVPPPKPTSIEVTVKDENANLVSGASVKLFTNENDWLSQSNEISITQTNSSGVATFSNLTSRKYHFFVEKGCRNNYFENSATASAIELNTTSKGETKINPSGTIYFQNNSSNPYAVYLNGTILINSLAGGASKTYYYAPAATYTIRVLQLSGYGAYPTDKTYTGTVTCNGNLQAIFP